MKNEDYKGLDMTGLGASSTRKISNLELQISDAGHASFCEIRMSKMNRPGNRGRPSNISRSVVARVSVPTLVGTETLIAFFVNIG